MHHMHKGGLTGIAMVLISCIVFSQSPILGAILFFIFPFGIAFNMRFEAGCATKSEKAFWKYFYKSLDKLFPGWRETLNKIYFG